MSNAFEDFINGTDGPSLDDFQGVTRSDNGKIERGDRNDKKQAKRKAIPYVFDEEESKAKLRAKLSDMGDKHRRAVIESGYGQVPEGQKINYREIHAENAKRSHESAIKEASAFEPMRSSRSDLHGTPTPGYVAPHERGKSGSGVIPLVVMMCLMLGLAQIFLG